MSVAVMIVLETTVRAVPLLEPVEKVLEVPALDLSGVALGPSVSSSLWEELSVDVFVDFPSVVWVDVSLGLSEAVSVDFSADDSVVTTLDVSAEVSLEVSIVVCVETCADEAVEVSLEVSEDISIGVPVREIVVGSMGDLVVDLVSVVFDSAADVDEVVFSTEAVVPPDSLGR